MYTGVPNFEKNVGLSSKRATPVDDFTLVTCVPDTSAKCRTDISF